MYCVYLAKCANPIEADFELVHKSRSILDCLLYVYGVGDFILKKSNSTFRLHYKESDFHDFTNSTFTEPFFCCIKDILTTRELDKFKKMLRNSNKY